MNSPLLGLDIGFKRTGVALSESGIIAQPLTVLEADPPHMAKVTNEIIALVRRYDIKTIVAGQPYTEDGNPTSQSNKVDHFLSGLKRALEKERLEIDIKLVNEFYSTEEAKQAYPEIALDAASAALILQEFITNHS